MYFSYLVIREQNTITTIEFRIGDEMILKDGINEIKFEDDVKDDVITKVT